MKLSTFSRLAIAATAAGTLFALSGCAGTDAGSNGATSSLELWLPPLGDAAGNDPATWDGILSDFEKQHGVDVHVTIIPWESYEEKYLSGVASGQGPDVGYMYNEMIGDYIAQGALKPFDGLVSSDQLRAFRYAPLGVFDGQQYALPFVVGGVRVVYANQSILKAAGVNTLPTTWDEFEADSAKVVAAGYTATVQPWGAPDRGMLNETFFPALWQAGGDIFAPDGKSTAFNSDAGLKAATFLAGLKEKGYMPADVTGLTMDDAKQQFLDGKVAFFARADANRDEIAAAGIDYGVIPSLQEEQKGTFVAADSLVLLSHCPDTQLCADLVTYLESASQMDKVREFAPTYQPLTSDETPSTSEFADIYQAEPSFLHSLPIAAGSPAVYNALYQNLQQMILGQKTPQQALSDAATQGDAILAGK